MSYGVHDSRAGNLDDTREKNLAFLASQAAIEFDNLALGKQVELRAAGMLSELLKDASTQISSSQEPNLLIDPTTVALLSSAAYMSGQPEALSLQKTAADAWSLALSLEKPAKEYTDRLLIERLRTFCSFLARRLVAHERTWLDQHTAEITWS